MCARLRACVWFSVCEEGTCMCVHVCVSCECMVQCACNLLSVMDECVLGRVPTGVRAYECI